MEDQYGMGDLRQYMNGRPLFHGIQQTSQDLCLNPSHPYDMLLFRLDNTTNYNNNNSSSSSAAAAATTSTYHHHHMTTVHGNNNSSDGGNNNNNNGGLSQHHVLESVNLSGDVSNNGRWPRQETLTLLEIRSRLDSKFKEANQKGPLWNELSRIMSEEHGYQRSGKKCREKFENLYKYYKKTKEGKAGRQDGKHYRFFRQLEALYGEAQNSTNLTSEDHFVGGNFHYNGSINPPLANNQETSQRHNKLSDTSLSLSNYSESETTSSEDDCDLNIDEKDPTVKKLQIGKKKSWKVKINDFMDAQMKKLMAKQEAWMEKMVKTIEQKEQERMMREEEWRKHDNARIEREHNFWANERAWIEARDSALMDALHKISGNNKGHQLIMRASPHHQEDSGSLTMNNINNNDKRDIWPECEISRLIQLRNAMEVKFQRRLASDDVLWEEIANKMACFGHDRSGLMCKDKWDSVNNYVIKCNKKRKENSPSSSKSCTDAYYHSLHQHDESLSNQGGESSAHRNEQRVVDHVTRLNKHLVNIPSISPNNADNNASESCFRFFMGDDYGRMMG